MSGDATRRDFLRRSGMVAAGALAAGELVASPNALAEPNPWARAR